MKDIAKGKLRLLYMISDTPVQKNAGKCLRSRKEFYMKTEDKLLDLAIELQSLAQAGLTYGKDVFDLERYARIREISAELLALKTDLPIKKIRGLFCNESGYQTPKLDTRSAIFQDGKILLVKENNGKWSLPGGWVDVNRSVAENAVKEVREEAGLDVSVDRVIAVQDRARHNLPVYPYGVCKIFLLCTLLGGSFKQNTETTESAYFPENALPALSEEKNTAAQIQMCFDAWRSKDWKTLVD